MLSLWLMIGLSAVDGRETAAAAAAAAAALAASCWWWWWMAACSNFSISSS